MLITHHNGKSRSECSKEFPRLRPGATVTVVTPQWGRVTGVVKHGCLTRYLVLEEIHCPLMVEDVTELILTEGSEL